MTRAYDVAFSGGGFRATLFHLGVVAFLRDAGALVAVRSIAAVSGGSILAGHLLARWSDYTGSDQRFGAAGAELIRFTRRGIRNRIVRRLPWIILGSRVPLGRARPGWWARSSTALLARYYDRYLFSDILLSELSGNGHPRVRFVATNVTDAGLACFSQDGYEHGAVEGAVRTPAMRTHALPLSLAVAASSAFPAFFPPLAIAGDDFGSAPGELLPDPQLFTDGGVIDNLGIEVLRTDPAGGDRLLILSDAGTASMEGMNRSSSGLLRTGIRAADLMMFRIRQLSLLRAELLGASPACLPLSKICWLSIASSVDPAEVPSAAPLGVQACLQHLRTDLDVFTRPEVQELIRHGYSVAARGSGLEVREGTALSALRVEPNGYKETRRRVEQLRRGARRRAGMLRGRDWLVVLYALLAVLAVGGESLMLRDQWSFLRTRWAEVCALRVIDRPVPEYAVRTSAPIIEDQDLQRGSNPGFEVLAEDRVWDLRRLVPDAGANGGPLRIRGSSLLTRTAKIRRDASAPATYKFWYLTSSSHFAAWTSTRGAQLEIARGPRKVRSGTADDLTLYELRVRLPQLEPEKALYVELCIETEDAFLTREDWWVGMRIGDPVGTVSMRVLFPKALPFKTVASTKYLNETPVETTTDDGAIVEGRDHTGVAWLVEHPDSAHTYRIQWDWGE